MKPSEAIREARNVLFERGWHQGAYEGPTGSVCIVGALNCAVNGFADEDRARVPKPVLEVVSAVLNCKHFGALPEFNDDTDTTFDNVLDVLDRAEKIAEQREALA